MAKDIREHLKSMSLGDHLEELRARMILAILGLFVGMVVCLFFGRTLIGVMKRPFDREIKQLLKEKRVKLEDEDAISEHPQAVIVTYDAITGYQVYKSLVSIGNLLAMLQEEKWAVGDPNAVAEGEKPNDVQGPSRQGALFAHHPTKGFVVYMAQDLEGLIAELEESEAILDGPAGGPTVVVQRMAEIGTLGPVEGFMVYIKTCLLFGLLITSPWVIWQIWAFVSAGLYQKEKKYVHVVSPISTILFVTGALFFMLVIAPMVMSFLIGFDARMGVRSFWSLQKYINMVFSLTIVFGAAFQMPIVIVFAERIGLVTVEALAKNRKFVILGLVVIAAMATPPDVISQISLAIPMYGLYEASILFCRIWRARGKKKKQG